MIVDGRRICEQPVQRDNGCDGGKDRKQRVEHHACRYSNKPIISDFGIGAPENVLPASPRDLPRRRRLPASAVLVRALALDLPRLIGATGAAEGARSHAVLLTGFRGRMVIPPPPPSSGYH
jgi:hypothetical protein